MEGGSIFQEGVEYQGISAQTIQSLFVAMMDTIYPVGSIYMSLNDTNPANLFGGTWSKIDGGRYLVASGEYIDGTQHTVTYTPGDTGGYRELTCIGSLSGKTDGHTLTANQSGVNEHTHGSLTSGEKLLSTNASGTTGVSRRTVASGSGAANVLYADYAVNRINSTSSTSKNATEAHTHNLSSNGKATIDTLTEPRHLVVNIWKRIA